MISLLSDPMSPQGEVEPADPQDAERGTLVKEHPGRWQCRGLGNVSQEQMTLKKKKSQPKCYVLEEESREVPQLLKLPCQHLRAVGWLAGSDKN